ncbi:MAG: penicillin-binding protein 2 [Acidobacteria bacterium]|nr:penicillin-binding protein 2 [Acidobacteriota bacterium]
MLGAGPRAYRTDQKILSFRVTIVIWLVVLSFIFLAGSFWYVQGVQADRYRGLSESNRLREVEIPAKRGLILDRHGKILVDDQPSYTLALLRRDYSQILERHPSHEERMIEFVAQTLEIDPESVLARIKRENDVPITHPLPLFDNLTMPQIATLRAHQNLYPALSVEVKQRRNYRYDTMAAHVLGYIGEVTPEDLEKTPSLERGDMIGKRGVELIYDDFLRGVDGARYMVVDSRGRTLSEYPHARKEPVSGSNIWLTIDFDLQRIAEEFFVENELVGAAVALDPQTGEVLAMVSSPAFNPNVYSTRFTPDTWKTIISNPFRLEINRAIQGLYSPGSVFKTVMGMAGFSEGVITPSTTFHCSGSKAFFGRRFRCWKREGHGAVNFERGIKVSCDIYFYEVGARLGINRIHDFSRKLSFGQATKIDLPGEKVGLVPSEQWAADQGRQWYPSETISVSIGQGPLLVTVLQTANMMSSIASGGKIFRPHVLRAVDLVQEDGSTERKRVVPTVLSEVELQPDALASMRDGLWKVVNEIGGTGGNARIEGLDVSGKTGTVQVIQQATWVRAESLPFKYRDHAFFASFAPRDNPRLAVVVFVEHGGHGGSDAAPLAREIYAAYFRNQIEQNRFDLQDPETLEQIRRGDLPEPGTETTRR